MRCVLATTGPSRTCYEGVSPVFRSVLMVLSGGVILASSELVLLCLVVLNQCLHFFLVQFHHHHGFNHSPSLPSSSSYQHTTVREPAGISVSPASVTK